MSFQVSSRQDLLLFPICSGLRFKNHSCIHGEAATMALTVACQLSVISDIIICKFQFLLISNRISRPWFVPPHKKNKPWLSGRFELEKSWFHITSESRQYVAYLLYTELCLDLLQDLLSHVHDSIHHTKYHCPHANLTQKLQHVYDHISL